MNSQLTTSTASKKPTQLLITPPLLIALLLIIPSVLISQNLYLTAGNLVTTEVYLSRSGAKPGSTIHLALVAEIEKGWHINSRQPVDEFAIPTLFRVNPPRGIELVKVFYPTPEMFSLEISKQELPLYQGRATFGAILRVKEITPPGSYTLTTTLVYQGCNDRSCIAPDSVTANITLEVKQSGEITQELHPGIFSKPPFTDESGGLAVILSESGEIMEPTEQAEESVGGMIEKRGFFLAFILIFFGGLALNLTPCIYPIIPITVSYFVGQSGGKTSRTLTLAVLYVLGMSITYSLLGTIAATTGALFGSALQNPYVVSFISVVMLILAASMFGAWEIQLPSFLTRGTGSARKGYAGAIFMGLTVGIVAAPCIGPFVLGLLTYVGRTGNPLLGFLMFFTLSWGMGVPFLVLGTLSGNISRLPSSGSWMVWVKKIFGFILIGMAFYFARHLIGSAAAIIGYAATALAGGLYLGWIDRVQQKGRWFAVLRRLIGVVGIALSAFLVAVPGGLLSHGNEPGIEWKSYHQSELSAAETSNIPVMIDFTADWCIPCHELDNKTLSDPGVITLSRKVLALRADLTKNSEREKKLRKKYNIRGVPTIIFLDRSGKELTNLRVTGFMDTDEIKKRLEQVISTKP
jgi:thiol:disulfide interchange protein DsbD